jgi:excisionase family DNA binding protein
MDEKYRLWTVREVSELARVSESWIYRQCRAQAIPHHRLGRRYRFTDQDLRGLMAQTAVEPIGQTRLKGLKPTSRSVPRRKPRQ